MSAIKKKAKPAIFRLTAEVDEAKFCELKAKLVRGRRSIKSWLDKAMDDEINKK